MGGPDRRILILAPMRSELRPVLRAMSRGRRRRGDQVAPSRDTCSHVTASLIGVGPDAARRSTERLLGEGGFDHVVVSGIAGGIDPALAVGSLVIPSTVEDLASGRRYEATPLGDHRPDGVIGTTHELILDEGRLAALVERGVVALDMETAAVADVCEAHGCPWSAYRVVSDRPQDGLLDHGVFEMLEADGTVHLGRAIRYVVAHPARIRHLARLARDSSAAASLAARTAVAACDAP